MVEVISDEKTILLVDGDLARPVEMRIISAALGFGADAVLHFAVLVEDQHLVEYTIADKHLAAAVEADL